MREYAEVVGWGCEAVGKVGLSGVGEIGWGGNRGGVWEIRDDRLRVRNERGAGLTRGGGGTQGVGELLDEGSGGGRREGGEVAGRIGGGRVRIRSSCGGRLLGMRSRRGGVRRRFAIVRARRRADGEECGFLGFLWALGIRCALVRMVRACPLSVGGWVRFRKGTSAVWVKLAVGRVVAFRASSSSMGGWYPTGEIVGDPWSES